MNKIYICCNDPLGKPGLGQATWLEWLSYRTHSFHASNQKMKCRPLRCFMHSAIFLFCIGVPCTYMSIPEFSLLFLFCYHFLMIELFREVFFRQLNLDSTVTLFNLMSIRNSLFGSGILQPPSPSSKNPYYLDSVFWGGVGFGGRGGGGHLIWQKKL